MRLLVSSALAASAALAATLVVSEGTASAMAAPPCMPAALTPSASDIVIPANIPGFGYTAVKATSTDVHLFSASSSSGAELPLAVGPVEGAYVRVAPKTALVPGTAYRLEYNSFCSYGPNPGKPLTFTAGPEAPLPTKLADLVGTPTVTTKDFGSTQYTIVAQFAVAPEMKPWLDVYQVALSVDGRLASTMRAASGESFTATATGWCDATTATKKSHTVQLKARLPFAPSVETAPTELTFDCPGPKLTTAPPYTGPTSGPVSGGPTLGGGNGGNAGTPGTPGTASSGGCAIALDASSSSPIALGVIALSVAAAVSRRRRR